MAQATLTAKSISLAGGEDGVETDEESLLLEQEGEGSVHDGQAEPIVPYKQTAAPTDELVERTPAATITAEEIPTSSASVGSSVITGMANLGRPTKVKKVKKDSDTTSMETGDEPEQPTQQFFENKLLPFMNRCLINLTILMTAWVAGTYECPYPLCLWTSQGTHKDDGTVVRPDRWHDFLEHWYCLHMIPGLVFKCTVEGCANVARVFPSSRRLGEHVRGHYKDKKGQDDELRKPLKTALELFSAHAGAEPDMKALQRTIRYPEEHMTRKQYDENKKAKYEAEKKANEAIQLKKKAEEKEKKKNAEREDREKKDRLKEEDREKKDRQREEDRKARHSRTSSPTRGSMKRDHSTGLQATAGSHSSLLPDLPIPKKARKDLVADRLSVRHYERSISMECFRQITGSFGALNLAWNSVCKTQMAASEAKISDNEMSKVVTCEETDSVRNSLNQFRNDIDMAASHMAVWQENLGDTPFAVPPSKMLLSPSVLMEARQNSALKDQLNTSRSTCNKLAKDLCATSDKLRDTEEKLKASETRERDLSDQLAAMEIRATPLPPATFGGEPTFLNRPTSRNEIALFQAQLATMNEYWGEFH